MSNLGLNVGKSKVSIANFVTLTLMLEKSRHLLPRKKLITTAKRKKVAKVGLEPASTRAADAHAAHSAMQPVSANVLQWRYLS